MTQRELSDFLRSVKAEAENIRPERERRLQRLAHLRARVKALAEEMATAQAEMLELQTAGVVDDEAGCERLVIEGHAEQAT